MLDGVYDAVPMKYRTHPERAIEGVGIIVRILYREGRGMKNRQNFVVRDGRVGQFIGG